MKLRGRPSHKYKGVPIKSVYLLSQPGERLARSLKQYSISNQKGELKFIELPFFCVILCQVRHLGLQIALDANSNIAGIWSHHSADLKLNETIKVYPDYYLGSKKISN